MSLADALSLQENFLEAMENTLNTDISSDPVDLYHILLIIANLKVAIVNGYANAGVN